MAPKKLDDLLHQYNSVSKNKELEIRYQNATREMFISLLNSLTGSKAVEQSLNAISSLDKFTSLRREIYFTGNKSYNKYIQKKTIGFVFVDGKKISLAEERELPEQKLGKIRHIRFKSRISGVLDDWRIDLTIVKNMDPNAGGIKELRQAMFNDPHPDKFITEGPFEFADRFEIELEYQGHAMLDVADIHFIIDKIDALIDPNISTKQEYQEKLYTVAKHIKADPYLRNFKRDWGLKNLVNQPIELSRKTYTTVLPNITQYYVTDKADGERCVVYISDAESYILTSTKVIPINIKGDITILDAELVKDIVYLFDIIYFAGEKLLKKPFFERVKYFDKAAKLLGKYGDAKPMIGITESLKEIKQMYSRKIRPYDVDGLMLTPANGLYEKMRVYKWKPVNKLSADFLILKPPAKILGIKPFLKKPDHEIYFLFCGIRTEYIRVLKLERAPGYNEMIKGYNGEYVPIQFSPNDDPYAYIYYHPTKHSIQNLHYHIGEFVYKDGKWHLDRMRPDKDVSISTGRYGNDYKTIDMIWQSARDPLTIDDLTNKDLTAGYFAKEKLDFYKAVAGFNSFVKGRLIENFRGAKYIVDGAAGRGQDLFRIADINVATALFIDIDSDAITELNSRKYGMKNEMKIFTWVKDLSLPADKVVAEFKDKYNPPTEGVDGFMINFAIHYIAGDVKQLRNTISIIKGMLRTGGRVIITCFDGGEIFELLKPIEYSKSWDIYEGEVLKYSLRKLYKSASFAHGQQIAVKLPFTGENYYEEPLMDTQLIVKEFEAVGFEYEIFNPFGDYLSQFELANAPMFKNMTPDDKKYVNLYTSMTFYLKK